MVLLAENLVILSKNDAREGFVIIERLNTNIGKLKLLTHED